MTGRTLNSNKERKCRVYLRVFSGIIKQCNVALHDPHCVRLTFVHVLGGPHLGQTKLFYVSYLTGVFSERLNYISSQSDYKDNVTTFYHQLMPKTNRVGVLEMVDTVTRNT